MPARWQPPVAASHGANLCCPGVVPCSCAAEVPGGGGSAEHGQRAAGKHHPDRWRRVRRHAVRLGAAAWRALQRELVAQGAHRGVAFSTAASPTLRHQRCFINAASPTLHVRQRCIANAASHACARPLQVSRQLVQDDFEAGQGSVAAAAAADATGPATPTRLQAARHANITLPRQPELSVTIALRADGTPVQTRTLDAAGSQAIFVITAANRCVCVGGGGGEMVGVASLGPWTLCCMHTPSVTLAQPWQLCPNPVCLHTPTHPPPHTHHTGATSSYATSPSCRHPACATPAARCAPPPPRCQTRTPPTSRSATPSCATAPTQPPRKTSRQTLGALSSARLRRLPRLRWWPGRALLQATALCRRSRPSR